jgi:hypothetical protein
MVEFGEKIASEMIPEWRDKYVRFMHMASHLDKLSIKNTPMGSSNLPCHSRTSTELNDEETMTKVFCAAKSYTMQKLESKVNLRSFADSGLDAFDFDSASNSSADQDKLTSNCVTCKPFKTEMTVKLQNGDELSIDVDCWRFNISSSNGSVHHAETNFIDDLNDDILRVVDFQARLLC